MKNVTKFLIVKTFALEINGKFADHNLEKLCPWSLSLASTISVCGESVPKILSLASDFLRALGLALGLRLGLGLGHGLGLDGWVLDSTSAKCTGTTYACHRRSLSSSARSQERLRAKPASHGRRLCVLEKLDISMPFESSFESFRRHLKELILLRLKTQLKN